MLPNDFTQLTRDQLWLRLLRSPEYFKAIEQVYGPEYAAKLKALAESL